jgi:hypothetical protein
VRNVLFAAVHYFTFKRAPWSPFIPRVWLTDATRATHYLGLELDKRVSTQLTPAWFNLRGAFNYVRGDNFTTSLFCWRLQITHIFADRTLRCKHVVVKCGPGGPRKVKLKQIRNQKYQFHFRHMSTLVSWVNANRVGRIRMYLSWFGLIVRVIKTFVWNFLKHWARARLFNSYNSKLVGWETWTWETWDRFLQGFYYSVGGVKMEEMCYPIYVATCSE